MGPPPNGERITIRPFERFPEDAVVKMRALVAMAMVSGLMAACGNEGDVAKEEGGGWPFGPNQFRNPDLNPEPTGTPPVGSGPIWQSWRRRRGRGSSRGRPTERRRPSRA